MATCRLTVGPSGSSRSSNTIRSPHSTKLLVVSKRQAPGINAGRDKRSSVGIVDGVMEAWGTVGVGGSAVALGGRVVSVAVGGSAVSVGLAGIVGCRVSAFPQVVRDNRRMITTETQRENRLEWIGLVFIIIFWYLLSTPSPPPSLWGRRGGS
jgi:hypothetical protein